MQNTTKNERLTVRQAEDEKISLVYDEKGNVVVDKRLIDRFIEQHKRLSELENQLDDGELVSKDWHDEQVGHYVEENARLEKRNSALLVEKDAMEANCIALQKQLDEVKSIGTWVYEIHKNAVQHGWYDGQSVKNFGELLMLVVTEVAEVMEEYRNGRLMKETYVNEKGKMCGIPSELADIVIRVMDICGYYEIDLEQAIAEKHEYNKSRPYKHGGKKC